MRLKLFQVDAFTTKPFAGNPAAVVPLDRWLEDDVLQAIAAENNLSETAFYVPHGDDFELRWFTPKVEVALCGHATLATAFVVARQDPQRERMRFVTRKSGALEVVCASEGFVMDFPAFRPVPVDRPDGLEAALGGYAVEAFLHDRKDLAIVADEATVRAITPDFRFIANMRGLGLIVSAPGDEVDFVSRFFAPGAGIDEDPVTGSAHCVLAPYWAQRLGRPRLRARQVSARGGELQCELAGDRVRLTGNAVLYLEGEIELVSSWPSGPTRSASR